LHLAEGLVTVRATELETAFAYPALVQKLAMDGFISEMGEPNQNRLSVKWEAAQADNLGSTICNFVFQDWLYAYMESKLAQAHHYLSTDELEYIALLTFHGLKNHEGMWAGHGMAEWNQNIAKAFADVLRKNDKVHIDGVLRFRARNYFRSVDVALNEMVEQFLTDREYEEFVAMLRYMLDAQPASTQVLHVYCADERVWISDAAGQLVRDLEVTAAACHVSKGEDVNAEDLAMSILITRSPCQIIIHDFSKAAPWPSFSETLERVFVGRTARCNHCSTCQKLERAGEVRLSRGELHP